MPIIKVYGAREKNQEVGEAIVRVTERYLNISRNLIKILFIEELIQRDQIFIEIEMIRPRRDIVAAYLDKLKEALSTVSKVEGISLKLFDVQSVFYKSDSIDRPGRPSPKGRSGASRMAYLLGKVIRKSL